MKNWTSKEIIYSSNYIRGIFLKIYRNEENWTSNFHALKCVLANTNSSVLKI